MSVRRLRSASSTKRTKNDETKTCPIVGIGASAGGLEAVTSLLNHLPIDTGFGFVLVQHLDPEHESALTQLLARATSMPVTEITHNLPVEPNHVYVIPPNAGLRIQRGVLTLLPPDRRPACHITPSTCFWNHWQKTVRTAPSE